MSSAIETSRLVINYANSNTVLLCRTCERTLAAALEVSNDTLSSNAFVNKGLLDTVGAVLREFPVVSVATSLDIGITGDADLSLRIIVENFNDIVNLVSLALADVVLVKVEPDVLYISLELRCGCRCRSGFNNRFRFGFRFGFCNRYRNGNGCGNGLLAKTNLEAEERLILPVKIRSKTARLGIELVAESIAYNLKSESNAITELEISTDTGAANGRDKIIVPALCQLYRELSLSGSAIVECIICTGTQEQIGIENATLFITAKIGKVEEEVQTALSIIPSIACACSGKIALTLISVKIKAGTNNGRELPTEVESRSGKRYLLHKCGSLTYGVACAALELKIPVRIKFLVLRIHHKSDDQHSNN